jgi:hypothetical protein
MAAQISLNRILISFGTCTGDIFTLEVEYIRTRELSAVSRGPPEGKRGGAQPQWCQRLS